MKKIFQKNQIAITALAIMIAVAGYLNFTEQNTSSDGTKKTAGSVETIDTMDISDGDSLIKEKAKASKDVSKSLSKNSSENAKETQTDANSETIGDAVLTQAQVSEYVAGARMEREQTHSKTKESLNEIINSTSVRIFEKILSEKNIDAFNGAQGRILYVLWQEDGISIRSLSTKCGLAITSLTTMLERMENHQTF